MKILSFSYCFPNAAKPTWGVFVQQRLAALAKLVDLEVVSPWPEFPVFSRLRDGSGQPDDGQWEGLVVHRPRWFYLPGVLKSLDARFYARGIRRWLADLCRHWGPDLLDAHFVWPDGVGVSLLARGMGLPYAITLRGKIYPCLEVPSQRRQCADALRHAAVVISVDSKMASVAQGLGVDRGRIHVIPNGVDTSRFHPRDKSSARRELGLPLDGRLLVTVAHLGPRKGHREAVQALACLPADVRLVIVGPDPERGKNDRMLRKKAHKLGLDGRVLLVGPQPHEKVPLYFAAADASVLASYREGCPNVVLESLACGTPVVATDVGAVQDIVHPGRNGEIVPARDADALAAGLVRALARNWDARQVAMSTSVRSWDEVARQVYGVLAGALKHPISPALVAGTGQPAGAAKRATPGATVKRGAR